MSVYKLTYFDMKAKAEPIRFVFHLKNIKFEDIRITREQWKTMKADMPQGKIPILEFDGNVLPQTNSILRYQARKYDLYGEGIMENTRVDVVLETVEDVFVSVNPIYYEQDPTKKEELRQQFKKNSFYKYCEIFSKILDNNKTGWMVGSKMTVADLTVYNIFEYMQDVAAGGGDVEKSLLLNNATLLQHRRKVREEPAILQYLTTRPVTDL